MNHRGRPNFMTADRMRFHSTRSSESRSEETPVIVLFCDVFRLMGGTTENYLNKSQKREKTGNG
jgi:hypothetical protein